MNDYRDLLKNLNNSIPNSAMQAAKLDEARKILEQKQKEEELNSPTNQYLRDIIQKYDKLLKQSNEQIQLLSTQNDNLKKQLKITIESEKDAKKRAKQDRTWVYISTSIAFASLIATILISILK